jgi:GxxExxY protein
MTSQLLEEGTTQSIIGAFYQVYNVLGPGLLEKAYSGVLAYELELRGHLMSRESPAEIRYSSESSLGTGRTWSWTIG